MACDVCAFRSILRLAKASSPAGPVATSSIRPLRHGGIGSRSDCGCGCGWALVQSKSSTGVIVVVRRGPSVYCLGLARSSSRSARLSSFMMAGTRCLLSSESFEPGALLGPDPGMSGHFTEALPSKMGVLHFGLNWRSPGLVRPVLASAWPRFLASPFSERKIAIVRACPLHARRHIVQRGVTLLASSRYRQTDPSLSPCQASTGRAGSNLLTGWLMRSPRPDNHRDGHPSPSVRPAVPPDHRAAAKC